MSLLTPSARKSVGLLSVTDGLSKEEHESVHAGPASDGTTGSAIPSEIREMHPMEVDLSEEDRDSIHTNPAWFESGHSLRRILKFLH